MDMGQNDFDRLILFEHARKTCEAAYIKDPLDAENLTRWGGALMELAQFQNGNDSVKMLNDAVSKLEEALEIDPKRHETLWCLGNAITSQAFCTPDHDAAMVDFSKASDYFQRAVEEEPGNELYLKSFEISAKAPELHLEFQRQMASQQAASHGSSSSSTVKKSKEKINSDLTYDILGWVILAVGIIAWAGMAKSHVPPPPPPR